MKNHFVAPGKYLRFPQIFQRKTPLIICPIDDFLIFGAQNGLEDANKKIQSIISAKPDAILTFAGSVSRSPNFYKNSNYIINLTASTVRSAHTKKVQSHSIEEALRLNASGVAAHINICSKYASEMIDIAGNIISDAQRYEIPTIGIIYPRGEIGDEDNNNDELKRTNNSAFTEIVAHCVSLGVDLGFDAIKTVYTDSPDSFNRVIKASCGIPVLIAGGPKVDLTKAIELAKNAISAGAAGISFGRNIFGREEPREFIEKIRKAINTDSVLITKNFVEEWLANLRYAWVNNDLGIVGNLFKECQEYIEAPFMNPGYTLDEIKQFWSEVSNHSEVEVSFEIISISGSNVVVNYKAQYFDGSQHQRSNGVYSIEFNAKGSCTKFKQWSVVQG